MLNGLVLNGYGDKFWFKNGLLHNENGPAAIISFEPENYIERWYINGKLIPCSSQLEFEKLIRLKSFW